MTSDQYCKNKSEYRPAQLKYGYPNLRNYNFLDLAVHNLAGLSVTQSYNLQSMVQNMVYP